MSKELIVALAIVFTIFIALIIWLYIHNNYVIHASRIYEEVCSDQMISARGGETYWNYYRLSTLLNKFMMLFFRVELSGNCYPDLAPEFIIN